jgi:hypothetical protein
LLKFHWIHPSHRSELKPTFSLALLMLLLVFNALLLPVPDASRGLASYLPLHMALEVVAIAIAALVFAVGWSTQKYNANGNVSGTGYSSMSYLKRFSVDKLKIDQSFVRELEQNPDDLAIVTAISQMAHGLGMIAIAEGVETAEQAQLLRQQGCDEIQGYLYSPPLKAEQLAAFARQPNQAAVVMSATD